MESLIDRFFRRPSGPLARRWWRDPKPHHGSFRDTLQALTVRPDDRLLEIGCGGGTFLQWALASGCTAKAVDHSSEMVRLAADVNDAAVRAGRLEVREAPGERLPFADGEFTCAAIINTFFFLDAQAVLQELHRVLGSGGRLVIHTVAPHPPSTIAPPPLARRMRCYSDDELVALLVAAGFGDAAVQRLGNGSLQLVTARRP